MKEIVKSYIDKGLIVLPVDAAKRPILVGWQNLTIEDCRKDGFLSAWDKPDMKVGLLCGGGNECEALDFDLKNSLDPDLFIKFCAEVKKCDPNLLQKLTVQQTMSGGFHMIYKCSKIDKNLKLSRRPATHEEIITSNAKAYVEIETRGDKGMVVIAPSNGYKLLRNTFTEIQTITPDERDLLLTVARSFNTYEQPHAKPTKFITPIQGENIWEEFNSDTYGGLSLLFLHGWTQVKEKGDDILLKRPGNTSAAFSAYYHTRTNVFVPFTSSSEFEPEKGYSNSQILHIIEGHNGDWKQTAKRLREMGYGKVEYQTTNRAEKVRQDEEKGVRIEKTETDNTAFRYIEDSKGYVDYLERSRTGTLEKGLTTGSRWLDAHFVFKKGDFCVTLAFPSVGKSFFWWFLASVSNRIHKWKWVIFSSENKTGQIIKKIIELNAEKKISLMTKQEVDNWRDFIDNNFKFINSDQAYTAKDILRIAEEYNEYWKFDGLLIDPYNSLMVGGSGNTYQYHYEMITLMRSFCNRTGIFTNLNVHPNTTAGRNRNEDGRSKTPQPSDAENGIMFFNRADEFLILDRNVDDEHTYRQTFVHVKKIKDWETGGKPTPPQAPVRLTLMDNVSFIDDNQVRLLSGKMYYEQENPVKPNVNFDADFQHEPKTTQLFTNTNQDAPF